jgi:hypothetical protein
VLVVDEASQIEIGEYLSVFTRYLSIRKICFVGDDKQCEASLNRFANTYAHVIHLSQYPRMAKKTLLNCKVSLNWPTCGRWLYFSILSVCLFTPVLIRVSLLLADRMPPQIGDFVSKAVYDGKLLSNPLHPVKNSVTACHFVDVAEGKEEFQGTSWMVRFL